MKDSKRAGRKRDPKPYRPPAEGVQVSESALKDGVGQVLSPGLLGLVASSAASEYRKRILSIEVMLVGLIDFVLRKLPSFQSILDRLRGGEIAGLARIEVARSSFYDRLETISHTVFLQLLRETTAALSRTVGCERRVIAELAPFANGVYAVDDTTLDKLMRRTKWLKEYPKGGMETLGGRLGCALNLATGRVAEILYDPDSKANEKNHARPLIERLPAGALYVFDLGYFSFPFFDYLTERYCYFVSRLRQKTSFKVIQVLAEGPVYRDTIVYLGKYRADQAAHPVRLVELLIDGKWYSYLTNVCDPRMLPAPAVWALYGQRWHIEMAFAAIKRGLGMAFLRPSHQNGILIQIWSTLTVYQVLQNLRLEIAREHGWEDDDVSWTSLTRWIGWYGDKIREASLRSWLCEGAKEMGLKKRGVRKRKRDRLPADVLKACHPPPPSPTINDLVSRTARQGKPQPRIGPLLIIVGALA
jgi:hypothetical protein